MVIGRGNRELDSLVFFCFFVLLFCCFFALFFLFF